MNDFVTLSSRAVAVVAAVCACAAHAGMVTVDAARSSSTGQGMAALELVAGQRLSIQTSGGQTRLATPYAALGVQVGQIGPGDDFLVGAAFGGIADGNGMLTLYFRDADAAGNAGQLDVKAAADNNLVVPEPSTAALAGAALAAATSAALGLRRRRRIHI